MITLCNCIKDKRTWYYILRKYVQVEVCFSLGNTKCLRYFFIATTKYHNQGNMEKKEFNLKLTIPEFQGWQIGRQCGAGTKAKSLHQARKQEAES